MQEDFLTTGWFRTVLGKRCLATEQRIVKLAMERMFGEQMLQIGIWGGADTFLPDARTQRAAVLEWRGAVAADFVSNTDKLAVASDSVDVVLLPHTLELIPSPHALLREVDRVLLPNGYLVILSFTPNGVWGLRHLLSRYGYPPGHQRLIREGRLRDWLELLSFEIELSQRYCYTLTLDMPRRLWRLPEDGRRVLGFLGLNDGYLFCAQKRVNPLTPIRRPWWQRHLKMAGGVAEPTVGVSQWGQSG